jgi:hypothetical protein
MRVKPAFPLIIRNGAKRLAKLVIPNLRTNQSRNLLRVFHILTEFLELLTQGLRRVLNLVEFRLRSIDFKRPLDSQRLHLR